MKERERSRQGTEIFLRVREMGGFSVERRRKRRPGNHQKKIVSSL